MAFLVTCGSLAFQLGPAAQAPTRASHVIMAEQVVLNNMVLDKPLSPLDNQLLVKLNKVDDKTDGGLFVGNGGEQAKDGVVVAAGPGFIHPLTNVMIPNQYSAGDLVLLRDNMGERVDYNNEKHLFIDVDQVLGKFAGAAAVASEFQPGADGVLISMEADAEETTATGIALALDSENKDQNIGEVVAVGEGMMSALGETIPMSVSVDDHVIFASNSGADTKIGGKKFKVVPSTSCLAKW
jgi:chaperonin GroES